MYTNRVNSKISKSTLSLKLMLFLMVLFTVSCRKDFDTKTITSIDELKVPTGFKWENARDVNFAISVQDFKFLDDLHLVSIYDKDPNAGGVLLAKGSATLKSPFLSTIYLAATLKEVYVVKTAPDNTSIGSKVSVSSTNVSVTVSGTGFSKTPVNPQIMSAKTGVQVGEDCTEGCTQTVTTNNTNLNVNSGNVVCVTGDNITIGFNANGGVIRICGKNVTIQNANLNNDAKLIVSTTGSIKLSSLNLNGQSAVFENYGTTTISGSFSSGGKVLNQGTLNVGSDFNLNSNAEFSNYAAVIVKGSFNLDTKKEVFNYSSITVSNNLQINGSATLTNNCKLFVSGNFINNSKFNNYGYVKVEKESTVNGNGVSSFYNSSMLVTTDMMLNGTLKGTGATSLVKTNKKTTINGQGVVDGALQYCDENGIETGNSSSKFINGAIRSCSVYIPKTDCNPEGNGVVEIVDTDKDGISDDLDEYPTDPTKAFNNYYPSASGSATLAFEDRWPLKGDYDLNDVVVSYKYKIVTNAENKVVQVNGDYLLRATGGGYANGFGVEFPLKAANAKNLVGGTLEAGQEKAVVILFTNMSEEMANWNTKPGDAVSEPVRYQISFDDVSGTLLKDFGLGVYNPFIWNGSTGYGRGYEVHLPGMKPTSLVDASLFGKEDDASNPSSGLYYLTSNGLPWAINIPTTFEYPQERVNIFKAYLQFVTWAESGGKRATDWYSNTSSSYRDSDLIYTK